MLSPSTAPILPEGYAHTGTQTLQGPTHLIGEFALVNGVICLALVLVPHIEHYAGNGDGHTHVRPYGERLVENKIAKSNGIYNTQIADAGHLGKLLGLVAFRHEVLRYLCEHAYHQEHQPVYATGHDPVESADGPGNRQRNQGEIKDNDYRVLRIFHFANAVVGYSRKQRRSDTNGQIKSPYPAVESMDHKYACKRHEEKQPLNRLHPLFDEEYADDGGEDGRQKKYGGGRSQRYFLYELKI